MSWPDFWGAVVAGLGATAIWVVCGRAREIFRLRRKFDRYAGRYSVTRKQETKREPFEVVVSVAGNVLDLTMEKLPSGDSGGGRILMDEQLRGEGHYWRIKKGEQLWGFWDVQVRDDRTLLLHETYSKAQIKTLVLSGFRWERVD
jgi:hypothetical protein